MPLSGHQIGLLKEYMTDLVEQAKQEEAAHLMFGFAAKDYRADQAIGDLLAILDDRIESEGVQVGLPEGFLHEMWTLCNEGRNFVNDQVWLESNIGAQAHSKSKTREMTYRALLGFLEQRGS